MNLFPIAVNSSFCDSVMLYVGLGDIRNLETLINSVLSPEIMSIVSMVNQATKLQSANTLQIEKAGWALRQRLRKQMNQLSSSFFR